MVRLVVLAAFVVAIAAFTVFWRRREGRFTEEHGVFDKADLGLPRNDKPCAAVVEFYGEGCPPCRTVEDRLEKIATEICDLKVIKVDAGARLDLADRYNVRRVPTLFVTDEDLKIVWRASGVPSEDAIVRALLGPDWAGRPHPATEPADRV